MKHAHLALTTAQINALLRAVEVSPGDYARPLGEAALALRAALLSAADVRRMMTRAYRDREHAEDAAALINVRTGVLSVAAVEIGGKWDVMLEAVARTFTDDGEPRARRAKKATKKAKRPTKRKAARKAKPPTTPEPTAAGGGTA